MPVIQKARQTATLLCLLAVLNCSSDAPSFEILYYSNLNGNIEACECYDVLLGGLHQIKPMVDRMRSRNSNVLLIDGGDTFNSYSFPELDRAVFDAYKLLRPDIWVPGEQELIEGASFFKSLVDTLPHTFVSGNLIINNIALEAGKEYSYNDKKIMFTSYIQADLFNGLDPEPHIAVKTTDLEKTLNKDFFNILIFHGDTNEYNRKKAMTKAFNLVLTSHQQSPEIDLDGETAVIGGGADGEFLVHIVLQENDSGFKISASKINIEQNENPDKQIVKIISDYRSTVGLDE